MARPLTRAQAQENAAFVRALRRSGNLRLAARECGLNYGTVQHRRAQHPAFAQGIAVALAFAAARLAAKGPQGPSAPRTASDPKRTAGGEPVVVRRRDGKLQMRRAQPGKLTKQAEQAFLAALSASANVRLAAAAAGAAEAAFYRRKRRDAAFAREWQLALEQGYEAIEMALLASAAPGSFEDDAWRRNDPPPIPPMTANQALQLLYLHQKEALLLAEPPHIKRRRGESSDAQSYRMAVMYRLRIAQDRIRFEVAEAERRARGVPWLDDVNPVPPLPDLALLQDWSDADPARVAADAGRALFGGWRIEEMEKRMGEGEA